MKVLKGSESALQPATQGSHSGRAMALMGAVFAFTALAALAIALLLEAPAADPVLPEPNAAVDTALPSVPPR